jgi:Uncharacterized conserved protein
MKLTLLMVGKMANDNVTQWFGDYIERLKHYLPTQVVMVATKTTAKQMSQQRDEEGTLILKQIKNDDFVMLLDDKGQEFTSLKLSQWLETRMNTGKNLVLVIGGAYGFSQAVYNRADGMLSLSRLTLPHQLVRVIVAEQLYRSMTIIKGEQYHHEDSLLNRK